MTGYLEHLTSVIRVGPEAEYYGRPYDWAGTVRWISPPEVEVMAFTRTLTVSRWKSVNTVLWAAGIRKAIFYRFKNGQKIKHTVIVQPY